MSDHTLIATTNINLELLREEIAAAGLVSAGILMAGFHLLRPSGLYGLNPARKEIGRRTDPADPTQDIITFADPGEIKFKFDATLTAPQEATLAATLAAHDPLLFTQAQQQQIDHKASAATLKNIYQQWNSLTPAQKDAGTREAIRRLARLIDKGTGTV
jgi:hypothetical protein